MRRHCFPELNDWFQNLPDPRRQDMCVYTASHLWWQILMTFLLRGGSRNAFDVARNTGELPENLLRLCGQSWDAERLGERRTITCSENARHHASRVPTEAVAQIPLKMVRRLMKMRLLDDARLFDSWWMILIDGTLQDRGRKVRGREARYRYVLEAKLVGPAGTVFHLMTEFVDVHDPVRDKEDCELNAFRRLAVRLKKEFPRLSICLLMDGLYAVEPVFNICRHYEWKFIATLKEGRQPEAWGEAVQTLMLEPAHTLVSRRQGEAGWIEQTLRWTEQVAFGEHSFQVLFAGEIGPKAATLWCWVTNFTLHRDRVYALANQGGRAREGIENEFNVEKNGGFGLEHAFCANTTASHNYHIVMQIARTLWLLLAKGCLHRLMRACRKVTDVVLVDLLRTSLRVIRLSTDAPALGQIRFLSSA